MPANLENAAVATGLEKFSFHSNPKERQSQNDRMISVHFQGKPFNIIVIQVYAPNSNGEGAEVGQFYEGI